MTDLEKFLVILKTNPHPTDTSELRDIIDRNQNGGDGSFDGPSWTAARDVVMSMEKIAALTKQLIRLERLRKCFTR